LGWSGFWEFNDSDFECSIFIIDTWMTAVAGNRSNIAPNAIPWSLLRIMVTETYGGKIDNASDFSVLSQLVSSVLTPAAFEENFALQQGLTVPNGTTKRDFEAWIKGLPEREPPTYLGLEANAEKLLLVAHADEMCEGLRRVMEVLDEGEAIMAEAAEVVETE
ncbi:dynein heavy chain, partial [Aureobasidium melanogenum]